MIFTLKYGNDDMKKILIVFTGGTIGSTVQNGWISPNQKSKYLLLETYSEHNSGVKFDTVEPYTVLSENLSAEHLNKLTDCVCDNVGKYDGIIVTHGTDTLQYSAAALSYAVGSSSPPVILVSSNYPLDDSRANGHANFKAAVDFIKGSYGKGVYISYRNTDGNVYFHSGTNTISHREMDDCVYSLGFSNYASYDEKSIKINNEYPLPKISPHGKLALIENPQILVIDSHPADSFDYCIDESKAVIIKPYHSGTLNTANINFCNFCKKCRKNNIPVYAVNIPDGVTYESSREFEDLGITPLKNTAFCNAYIKIWIDISNNTQ